MRRQDLERAQHLSSGCDLMIAMGSTLSVQPAASFPVIAKENGAALVVITLPQTPLDDMADLVFHTKLGIFIDQLA